METAKKRVADALEQVVCHPAHDERAIARFFAPDYQQVVDGVSLDYAQFVEHMAALKAITRRINLRILAAVVEGEQVFTHHLVEVEKRHGADAQVEVFAHFTLAAGNIVRCEELTRLINGDKSDKALGQIRRTASR
ncbi:nuclear transport factor 2 family protein [Cronobacter muytjensii]|uniref:Nuclear transport factor 2 family protein n=1 Tax=Cronobacter muytjensii TaxID=413501 RepID=A0A2T7AWQ4_9ENTR|nr:nuclear transport factor 2 family protein [Cronobacter muytjensii]KAB0884754.1 nuclear transport factor 2 family protein [Cronobacter muytjensii]MBF4813443.1 nuclear transport factor 2 family protein [Cronobacter muytjensii]PUX16677.1 nuclear transport factor 2 family protein [Cronobacter muytjensii]